MFVLLRCFINRKIELYIIEDNLNIQKYIDALQIYVLPRSYIQHGLRKQDPIFRQTNAPVHTAQYFRRFFEKDERVKLL